LVIPAPLNRARNRNLPDFFRRFAKRDGEITITIKSQGNYLVPDVCAEMAGL